MPLAFDAELFPLHCTFKRWLALARRLGWFIHHHCDDRLAAARSSATRGAAQWKIGPIPSLSCLVVRKLGVTRHRAKQRAQCTPSDIGGHATCDVGTLGRGGHRKELDTGRLCYLMYRGFERGMDNAA